MASEEPFEEVHPRDGVDTDWYSMTNAQWRWLWSAFEWLGENDHTCLPDGKSCINCTIVIDARSLLEVIGGVR